MWKQWWIYLAGSRIEYQLCFVDWIRCCAGQFNLLCRCRWTERFQIWWRPWRYDCCCRNIIFLLEFGKFGSKIDWFANGCEWWLFVCFNAAQMHRFREANWCRFLCEKLNGWPICGGRWLRWQRFTCKTGTCCDADRFSSCLCLRLDLIKWHRCCVDGDPWSLPNGYLVGDRSMLWPCWNSRPLRLQQLVFCVENERAQITQQSFDNAKMCWKRKKKHNKTKSEQNKEWSKMDWIICGMQ